MEYNIEAVAVVRKGLFASTYWVEAISCIGLASEDGVVHNEDEVSDISHGSHSNVAKATQLIMADFYS